MSLAFSKSWMFFCIPADCVSSVEAGPGSPLKPSISPDNSGLILRRGLAGLFILLHMKVAAVWCDGKAQLSTDKPIASQDDKAMKKIPGQALQRECLSCLSERARIKSVPLIQSHAVTFWMWTCFRDLPESKNSSFWLVSRCLVLSVSQLLPTDSEGSLPWL